MQINQSSMPHCYYNSSNNNSNKIYFKSDIGVAHEVLNQYIKHGKNAHQKHLPNILENIYIIMSELKKLKIEGKLDNNDDIKILHETSRNVGNLMNRVSVRGQKLPKTQEEVKINNELNKKEFNKMMKYSWFKEEYERQHREYEREQNRLKLKLKNHIDEESRPEINKKVKQIARCISDILDYDHTHIREKEIKKPELKRKSYAKRNKIEVNTAYENVFVRYMEQASLQAKRCNLKNCDLANDKLLDKFKKIKGILSLMDDKFFSNELNENNTKMLNLVTEKIVGMTEYLSKNENIYPDVRGRNVTMVLNPLIDIYKRTGIPFDKKTETLIQGELDFYNSTRFR